jgi:hypothetical protein
MTEKQAYKILTDTPIRAKQNHAEYSKALHMAIGALGKQIPKRVVIEGATEEFIGLFYCPCCDIKFIQWGLSRCNNCGQALLWDGDEE